MSMVNEAEAVNAQRDAHMAGGSVLERRVRSLEEMRRGGCGHDDGRAVGDFPASSMFSEGVATRVETHVWENRHIADLERQRDAAIQALDLRDDALTLANLRGDAWRDMVQAAETERDAARQVSADFRWFHGHALNHINAPSPWGRILPWLRGKDGR